MRLTSVLAPGGRLVRSILGVLLGCAGSVLALTLAGPAGNLVELRARGVTNLAVYVFCLLFQGLIALGGGAVAAQIAGRKPLVHAASVGALILVLKVLQIPQSWLHFVEGLVIAPSALLGGLERPRPASAGGTGSGPSASGTSSR